MAGKKNTGKARGAKNQKNAAPKNDMATENTILNSEAASYVADTGKTTKKSVKASIDKKELPVVEKNPGDLPAVENKAEELTSENMAQDLPAADTNPGDLPAADLEIEASPAKAETKTADSTDKKPVLAEKAADKKAACTQILPVGKISPRMPEGIEKRPVFSGNPYLPKIARVIEVIQETHNIKTLRLTLEEEEMENFVFEPGQVGQLSVFGVGEATFVINSPPSQKSWLQFSIMRAGELTESLHKVDAGDKIGLRAPLGNFFPYHEWKGKNVFFIGGGIGMAPIRTIMLHLLENKQDYGKISLLYGARSPKDMAYSYELDAWRNNPDLDCTLCIDNPYENWEHKVGLIPTVLEELHPAPENSVAVICGPPIMINFTLQSLQKLGFEPQNIVTTLEKRMKCGIGICGRCNIGDRYVCVDGPVFTLAELDCLPPDL